MTPLQRDDLIEALKREDLKLKCRAHPFAPSATLTRSRIRRFGNARLGRGGRAHPRNDASDYGFNDSTHNPDWCYEKLTLEMLKGAKTKRTEDFRHDAQIPRSAELSDYKGSGWSRGHMVPAADNILKLPGILGIGTK